MQYLFSKQTEKKEKRNPEMDVQNGFKKWIKEKRYSSNEIINFRSNARKNGKWKNVDGYLVIPVEYEYHLMFKPLLTTFEVKANLPSQSDIAQARNYLKFSNEVYLIFNDNREEEEIRNLLDGSRGLMQPNDPLGVYITSDNTNFKLIKRATFNHADELSVDQAIEYLLSTNDKENLNRIKYEYLQKNIISLLS